MHTCLQDPVSVVDGSPQGVAAPTDFSRVLGQPSVPVSVHIDLTCHNSGITVLEPQNSLKTILVQCMNIPKAGTVGISVRVPYTLYYITALDYDRIKDERLVEELIVLQEVFPGHLGDFHVFYTHELGRHAMCIDRLLFRENKDVVYASSCDYEYKWGWRINEGRTWIARVLEKGERDRPKYLYSIPSPYNGLRLQSQAHGMFLERFYGADVRLTNPDGNTELEIQRYKTSSNITIEELIKKYKPSSKVKLKDVKKEGEMVQRD